MEHQDSSIDRALASGSRATAYGPAPWRSRALSAAAELAARRGAAVAFALAAVSPMALPPAEAGAAPAVSAIQPAVVEALQERIAGMRETGFRNVQVCVLRTPQGPVQVPCGAVEVHPGHGGGWGGPRGGWSGGGVGFGAPPAVAAPPPRHRGEHPSGWGGSGPSAPFPAPRFGPPGAQVGGSWGWHQHGGATVIVPQQDFAHHVGRLLGLVPPGAPLPSSPGWR